MTLIDRLLVGFSSLVLAAGAAYAAGDAKDKSATGASAPKSFSTLDTNKDGWISRPEVAAHAELAAKFKAADKDDDGKLSRAEYEALSGASAAAGGGEQRGGAEKK